MLLSIIIPVYNVENFIERCVRSIADQLKDYSDIELILIDDGSSDNSLNKLMILSQEYQFLKLDNKENGGVSETRNLGIKKAKGKYLWFVDSDDYIDINFISEAYKILLKEEPDIFLFGHKIVSAEGDVYSSITYENEVLNSQDLIEKKVYVNSVCFKIIKKEIIEKGKILFDTSVITAEDFEFSFKLHYLSNKIITTKLTPYNYVVNLNSVSNKRSKSHLLNLANDSVVIALKLNQFLKKKSNINRNIFFKFWLNNYLYGLFFSLFRFNYDYLTIKGVIKDLKKESIYPLNSNNMKFKKRLFVYFANRKQLFFLIVFFRRMLIKNNS
ncbi:glycosyltransferase family 2 protein [Aquimarina agarilytica]|uniref:glycosyltransferase family 2 protein n=1 Tax=Aquimarina agarilytica TaxID=1087449 RepID=UPI000287A4D3|nr:glycosyltransferase family 2 protein [Aquimarina agarilytica]